MDYKYQSLFVHVLLLLYMYTYCCLCILIVVYVFLDAATLTEGFPCFFLGCKANAWVILAKTGHGPHSSKIVVFVVYIVCFLLFYILFVCKCVLPPGDNPIAVNKYIISFKVQLLVTFVKHLNCKLFYKQLHLKYLCNLARYWLQAPWGWHSSVETCRSVIVCEIIVHLLVIVQSKQRHFCLLCRSSTSVASLDYYLGF